MGDSRGMWIHTALNACGENLQHTLLAFSVDLGQIQVLSPDLHFDVDLTVQDNRYAVEQVS